MQPRTFVNPDSLLDPPGPYSQVVSVGDLAFVSGQVGGRQDGSLAGSGIVEQTQQAVANIGSALEAVGLDLDRVVKVTIYLVYEEDLAELVPYMDEAFPKMFPSGLPASTLLFVRRLFDPAIRIEIDAIAHA